MSLDIVWMPAALAAFYRIPHWRTAAAVDAAVLAFAAGSGLRVVVLHLYPTG